MHTEEVFIRHAVVLLSVCIPVGVLNILYAPLFDGRRKHSSTNVFASALQSR